MFLHVLVAHACCLFPFFVSEKGGEKWTRSRILHRARAGSLFLLHCRWRNKTQWQFCKWSQFYLPIFFQKNHLTSQTTQSHCKTVDISWSGNAWKVCHTPAIARVWHPFQALHSWSSQWLQILVNIVYMCKSPCKFAVWFSWIYTPNREKCMSAHRNFQNFPGEHAPDPLKGARACPRRDSVAITKFGVSESLPPPPPPWPKSWICH